MEKKYYVKPSMEVVKLQHQAQLLTGSDTDIPGGGDEPSNPNTYIPAMYQDDMNKLA